MPLPFITLFVVAIFSSSFLIFLVQPMVGKHILPWFGGTPAVWLLCLSFYQLCLFAGYGYAHLLIERVKADRQLPVHLVLLAAAFAVLPVLPDAGWKPGADAPPNAHILSMLAANVGLPFLALAATGPLVQAWFARAMPDRSPYALYAVSNVGSLLALLAYPFWVEPGMSLSSQSTLWSLSFAVCGVAVLWCAWLARRGQLEGTDRGGATGAAAEDAAVGRTAIGSARVLLWLSLPAVAVVLLMGVTNELCLDVANIPFLWIGPLAIYLLSFILSFASETFYRRGVFIPLAALSLAGAVGFRLATVGTLDVGPSVPVSVIASVDLFALFAHCMVLHGELYKLRPPAERLTAFYLCVSGGGALGGLFVALVAPLIFQEYHELRLGVVACWIFTSWLCLRHAERRLATPRARKFFAAAVVSGTVVLAVAVIGSSRPDSGGVLLYQARNFFGILRVTEHNRGEPNHLLFLRHGTTNHGSQTRNPKFEDRPTAYFGHSTGMGFVMQQRPAARMKVGIVGLGAGTLAAYGRTGDDYRFYEIDPNVIEVAQNEDYFSYLTRSKANVSIVAGDGRLSLERELEAGDPQGFHLLVLDAFSSDAIPVHLITVEAFALYLEHLDPDGVLAVNVTNSNVDIAPLVFRLADEFGLYAAEIINQQFVRHLISRSSWVILSRSSEFVRAFPRLVEKRRREMNLKPGGIFVVYPDPTVIAEAPRWTDDYSDLLSVIKTNAEPSRGFLRDRAAQTERPTLPAPL